ncbi:MAG: signal peptidase I [Nitrosopumilales archaeon]|nr:signal peptidase I [Nitrosopumilales archaeon]
MNKTLITIGLVVSVTLLIFPFVLYYGNDLMIVTSDSMIPILKPNDLLIVQRTEIDKIMVGDIIVFNSHIEGIGIVAHRAIEKFDDNGKSAINTQGDNVDEADAWIVHEEDLIGKVEGNVSYIGILLVDPVRYTLVIIIIVTAISLLREITSEAKLQKNK